MQTALFDYQLPPERIAQEPLSERDASKLLVLDRVTHAWQDRTVRELPELLRSGDLLVSNDTRVIPARLRAVREKTGGSVEIFLLPAEESAEPERTIRRVLMRSGGRLQLGETFLLAEGVKATLLERLGEAGDRVAFSQTPGEFHAFVVRHGEVPLPPYIHRPPGPSRDLDRERYQTIFAREPGAVAAPTAGLHFTPGLLAALEARGVTRATITLHVGPGTFRPVKAERVEEHRVDPEPFFISEETAQAVTCAKREGRRVVAVGTTVLRTLEGRWDAVARALPAGGGLVDLFVRPPFRFQVADALLTNFHLPKSSLLMLVAAFAAPEREEGIEWVLQAYRHALEAEYRFYSYGDACFFA
jgi:S-adenosylmethionine:tRNA ribosyltransferase-isomerase